MSSEELIEKIGESFGSDILYQLEEYFNGYTSDFDISESYTYTDYHESVLCDIAAIPGVALELAEKELPNLLNNELYKNIPEEELLILSALVLAKIIKKIENSRKAYYEGEEWSRDSSRVEYYGTKQRAFNRGYDSYIYDNYPSYYEYLNSIIDLYIEKKENGKNSK